MENNNNDNNYSQNSSYSYNNTNQENNMGNANSWSAQSQQSYTQSQQGDTQNQQQNGYNPYVNTAYTTYETPKPKKKERIKKEHKKGGFGIKLAKCAAIALVFGLIAGSVMAGTNYFWNGVIGTNKSHTEASLNKNDSSKVQTTATSAGVDASATDVSGIVKNVMPSIVAITNMSETQVQTWFGQRETQESQSCGSGIIVSQDEDYIYIATNNHVVAESKMLTVQFADDKTVTAEVKGTDAGSDLAVVAVKISDIDADTMSSIKVATLGSSEDVQVGAPAIAIGNALGYGQSVTTGVISALGREVTVRDENTGTAATNELIQTDAAINPGNSGGALINKKGEVIGINSVKYSDTTVEGMGYAIPIDKASPIIEKLINREVIDGSKAAYLGIAGVDVSSSVSQTYSMPEGIFLYQLESGSPAEAAGLIKGDIITSFDGSKVTSMTELESAMQYCAAGDEVEVVFQRQESGQYTEQTVTVTLGSKN